MKKLCRSRNISSSSPLPLKCAVTNGLVLTALMEITQSVLPGHRQAPTQQTKPNNPTQGHLAKQNGSATHIADGERHSAHINSQRHFNVDKLKWAKLGKVAQFESRVVPSGEWTHPFALSDRARPLLHILQLNPNETLEVRPFHSYSLLCCIKTEQAPMEVYQMKMNTKLQ